MVNLPHKNRINQHRYDIQEEDIKKNCNAGKGSYLCHIITLSMHSPFEWAPYDSPNLKTDKEMPETMRKYLNCVHYTDSCFGVWAKEIMESDMADNTTIVITGDHTIFKSEMLREMLPYANKHNLMPDGKNYCPLIIYSPKIDGQQKIDELCYQMDLFPTILSIIGAKDYYFQGFGVDLTDENARKSRRFTEQEAYTLSEKMLRSNWFAGK